MFKGKRKHEVEPLGRFQFEEQPFELSCPATKGKQTYAATRLKRAIDPKLALIHLASAILYMSAGGLSGRRNPVIHQSWRIISFSINPGECECGLMTPVKRKPHRS